MSAPLDDDPWPRGLTTAAEPWSITREVLGVLLLLVGVLVIGGVLLTVDPRWVIGLGGVLLIAGGLWLGRTTDEGS